MRGIHAALWLHFATTNIFYNLKKRKFVCNRQMNGFVAQLCIQKKYIKSKVELQPLRIALSTQSYQMHEHIWLIEWPLSCSFFDNFCLNFLLVHFFCLFQAKNCELERSTPGVVAYRLLRSGTAQSQPWDSTAQGERERDQWDCNQHCTSPLGSQAQWRHTQDGLCHVDGYKETLSQQQRIHVFISSSLKQSPLPL